MSKLGVHTSSGWYHFDCYEKKELKQKIFHLFCDYVTNDENGTWIRKKISDYIDKEGYSASYVYFTLHYIVVNKIPLRSIFGLKLVMQRKYIQDEYNKMLNKYQKIKIQPKNMDYVYKKELSGGWQDIIG